MMTDQEKTLIYVCVKRIKTDFIILILQKNPK